MQRRQKGSSGKKQLQDQLDDDGEDEADLNQFGYNQNGDDDEVSLDMQDAIANAEEATSSQRK